MRDIQYLSPSSISIFERSEEEFYEKYLADNRYPREPQNLAMAIGSAFDAFVKSYLYKELQLGDDERFEIRTIFEDQVEEQNRDEAWKIGEEVFETYKSLGGVADLLIMLGDSTDCRFEFKLQSTIKWEGEEVVLLGKPDLRFIHKDGERVLLDWKVNGYMSRKAPSPRKGYINTLGLKKKQHKDVMVGYIRGLKYNMAHPLEVVDKDWGRQLAIYGWLSGEEIGSEYLVAIDQIICGAGTVEGVAQHRCFVGADYQRGLYKRCCEIWRRCKSGHFWTQLSLEDSMARCKLLDQGPVTLEEERER